MLLNILTKIKANREYSNRRTWAANVWFQNENGNSAIRRQFLVIFLSEK